MNLTIIPLLPEGVSGYRVSLDARLVFLILTSTWVNMVFCTMFACFAPYSHDMDASEACSGRVLGVGEGCSVYSRAYSAVRKSAKAVTFALWGREFVSPVACQYLPVVVGDVFPLKGLSADEEALFVVSVLCGDHAACQKDHFRPVPNSHHLLLRWSLFRRGELHLFKTVQTKL